MASDWQKRMISFMHRFDEREIFNVTAVDYRRHIVSRRPCNLWEGDISLHFKIQRTYMQRKHFFGDSRAVNRCQDLAYISVSIRLKQVFPMMAQADRYLWMGQRNAVDHICNIPKLCMNGFHIFQAGRCVKKQVGNDNFSPLSA